MFYHTLLHQSKYPLYCYLQSVLLVRSLLAFGSQKIEDNDTPPLLPYHVFVGEVNEITNNLQKAIRLIHACHYGFHLVGTSLGRLVLIVYFLPYIVVIIWCVGCSKFCVVYCGVADTREWSISQKMWYVSFVSNMYLVVCICNSCIEVCWILSSKTQSGIPLTKSNTSGMRMSFFVHILLQTD